MRRRAAELWLAILWNVPAFFLSLSFSRSYLLTLLIFAVPVVYFAYHLSHVWRKLLTYSILFTTPLASVFSYLAHRDGSWFTPSAFPRIFGVYPAEDIVWAIVFSFYALVLYVFFYDRDTLPAFPKYFRRIIEYLWIFAFLFSLVVYVYPPLPAIPYFYGLLIAVMALLIPWWIILKHERLLPKILRISIFFLIPSILMEYVALSTGTWSFPGTHFIGWIEVGALRLPLEELAWILFSIPPILVFYELLADDMR